MTPIEFADYEPLIFSVIRKMHPWIGYDDIRDSDEYSACCVMFAKCRQSYDPSRGAKFCTYLHHCCETVVKNVSRTWWRNLPLTFDNKAASRSFYASNHESQYEAKDLAQYVMRHLVPKDRVLVQSYADRLSIDNLGKKLGVSRETARTHRIRALKRARAIAESVM